ncbi:GAF domain-containing sensor histidine kinase [Thioflexithrix psekupsensis]|uniref:histidine kinase n=1 Tax=Thioflexithrix psekupsensis TaxID=1570016 RepID=A0A251XBH5_9GAMM|nr:GAF domain-containing sensor histidine kinase [Thioflexithrix psekupsensis]OUD15497.1 hypothetical protein TPSD3_02960 [Thioflexithrix psekupsensis]
MKLFNRYIPAPKPVNETERLAALARYEILDSEFEQNFDDLAQLAAHICGTPVALISLIDDNRQWFKSHVGIKATETPRDVAFCAHAILQPNQAFIVPDAHKDPRFANSPLVMEQPFIRFYAGAPLVTAEGYALGTLCVVDSIPRDLTPQQTEALQALSRQVMAQLELRRNLIQLNQSNLELTRLNQSKNDFLNMAAHDLKNPLSAVKGYAEEIIETSHDLRIEEVEEMAKNIAKASQHMFELVINILDVNAIEHQMDNLKCEPVDIAEILQQLKVQYQQRAALKQIELKLQIDSQRLAYAHAASAQQVFDNLISNALKYSPFGRQVTIHLQVLENKLQVAVQDQGQGLSQADQQKLFQKFTRLSARPTGGEHSSGLGLFIVKRLVEAMHAEIYCESELGKGARFIVRFLLAADT